ncbi:hypothetical protein V6N11_052280 [Hibiscus sabdariffa]|uniref:RNase H type-1 domain-containing protein n=1 Tax=Hibiscus sabdariffa TaxID=183260 RepID=A0ABR2U9J1_9ROSI
MAMVQVFEGILVMEVNVDSAVIPIDLTDTCGGVLCYASGQWMLIIETDSVDVADLFSDQHEDLRGNTIVSTIHQMLNLDWEVKVCKMSRVCNRVVDALTKASRCLPVDEIIYHVALHFVHDLIRKGF